MSEAPVPGRRKRGALEAGIAALDRKARSVEELRRWLGERDFGAHEIEEAIAELIELEALDDERYADLFANDKRDLSGWGSERIAAALSERGVHPAVIERVCSAEGHSDQVERASDLLRRRGEEAGDDRARSRALGFLTRRGYSYEVAYDAVRALDRAA